MHNSLKFKVTGKVQGVFFRASTKEEALRLGITGWVKNMSDGSVEGVISGPEDKLVQMVAWLHNGPSAADVLSVVTEKCDDENFSGFDIMR